MSKDTLYFYIHLNDLLSAIKMLQYLVDCTVSMTGKTQRCTGITSWRACICTVHVKIIAVEHQMRLLKNSFFAFIIHRSYLSEGLQLIGEVATSQFLLITFFSQLTFLVFIFLAFIFIYTVCRCSSKSCCVLTFSVYVFQLP